MTFPAQKRRSSKGDGRRHSQREKNLLKQVRDVFSKLKNEPGGAKRVAEELHISLASFYNYAAGNDLPRMEVLDDARRRWGIKWKTMDPSELLRTQNVASAEQFTFAFLDGVRREDVAVAKIAPKKSNVLEITLQIRFTA